MRTPPPKILRELDTIARALGVDSCRKSARRVIVFDPNTLRILGAGYNAPPCPLACDGSEACRRDCAKICIHAEQMAITRATAENKSQHLTGLELVHGKFVDGNLVAGGPPSCWQCSKLVLEVDLRGVWLYQTPESLKRDDRIERIAPEWKFYNAVEFHWATLRECGLHNNLMP